MVRLTYFAVRGRVEPSRLMLEMAGAPYAFEAIAVEDWARLKPEFQKRTPFGQVPVLQDGELALCQSMAIHRYLARALDLAGEGPAQQARVDEVTETAYELILDCARLHWAPKFAELRPAHREATARTLAELQAYFARERPCAERWIRPDRYTLADAMMAYALETTLPLHPGLLESVPDLYRFTERFFASPGISEYVRSERRPPTWTVAMATFAGRPEQTHQWVRD